ncbi:MAG TPA: oligosaccharide flippase family protein, partial [Acidocella sp.]|nr:oligosaccharide flippase family protein [Acidocella sp.]
MSIKRHTLQNLAGSLVPIVVALVTVPIYLHIIGPARYGILSIVWLFLGYFGLFDLGLARASSYHIARLHDAEPAARASVFYTALAVNAGFGILGGICLYCVAPPIFEHFFKMPEQSRQAVLAVVPWLAFAIPIATVGGVLLGALQAREAFGAANIISAMNATFAQLTPLIVAWLHGPDIGWLVISVVLVRSFGLLPFAAVAYRKLPLGAGGTFDIAQIRALFSYGGWIMITNIMDPIMTTMDRMLIAGVIGADAVAYYSVPYNLVSRISTLPGALASSLFPR